MAEERNGNRGAGPGAATGRTGAGERNGGPGPAFPDRERSSRGRPPRVRAWLLLPGDALGISLFAAALLAGIMAGGVAAGLPLGAGDARALLEGLPLPREAVGTGASAFSIATLAALPLALLTWTLAFGRRQVRGRFRVDRPAVETGLLGGLGMLAIGAAGSWIAGADSPAALEVMRATRPEIVLPLLVGIAPLGEELYLRGRLYGVLEEAAGRRWAWFGSSAVFGLLHLAGGLDYLPLVLAYTGQGLLLAWLRDRTGGLVAPVLAHAANNLAGVLALYLARPG